MHLTLSVNKEIAGLVGAPVPGDKQHFHIPGTKSFFNTNIKIQNQNR